MQTNLTSSGNHPMMTGPGEIQHLSINRGAATADLILYDGTDATGTVMGTIDATISWVPINIVPWIFRKGLFIVISGNPDVTVIYGG